MVHRGSGELTEIGSGALPDGPDGPSGPDNPDGLALAVHVTELAALRRRIGAGTLAAPHRADSHVIILINRGRGRHTVDFETLPCSAGTLLWVRQGQVQQFQSPSRLAGTQIRFTATGHIGAGFPARLLDSRVAVSRRLTSSDHAEIGALVESLAAEYARADETHHRELLAHLLLALLLRIDRIDGIDRAAHPSDAGARTDEQELFERFEDCLERDFARTRRTADYAGLLGCTIRSLNQACASTAGHTAKDLIDIRVQLEAKRLLATTDESLTVIGHRLGFSEASTFSRFFTRLAGVAPGEFRRGNPAAQHEKASTNQR